MPLAVNFKADMTLRHIDKACYLGGPILIGGGECISAYSELDAQLRWSPRKDLEVSLIGRNLLHSSHQEFDSNGGDQSTAEVPRSITIQIRLEL